MEPQEAFDAVLKEFDKLDDMMQQKVLKPKEAGASNLDKIRQCTTLERALETLRGTLASEETLRGFNTRPIN